MANKLSTTIFAVAQRALCRFNLSVRVGLGLGLIACILLVGRISSAKVDFIQDTTVRWGMETPFESSPLNQDKSDGAAITLRHFNLPNSPNQQCTLQSISPGQTVSGMLTTGDCSSQGFLYDYYVFNGTAGQQVSATVSSNSFNPQLGLFLINPDDSLTTISVDLNAGLSNTARVPTGGGTVTLQSAGQYALVVTTVSAGQSGNYQLQFSSEGGGGGGNTVALTSGQPQSGSVSAPVPPSTGQLGTTQYTIAIPAGVSQLQVQINGNQPAQLFGRYDQMITVNSSGQVQADYGAPSQPTTNFTLTINAASNPVLRAGTLYLVVGNRGASTLNFTITATLGNSPPPSPSPSQSPGGTAEQEPNDTAEQANPLSVPGTRTGSAGRSDTSQITVNFDDGTSEPVPDLFAVNIAQSARLELRLTFTASADLDLFLIRLNAGRLEIINDSLQSSGTVEQITTAQSLAAGTYYVGIGAFSGSSTYTLTASIPGSTSCGFSILPTNASAPANGGTGSVSVATTTGCNWTATSNNNWLQITSGSPGSGTGQVSYSVQSNTSSSPRTGTLTIAGQTFTVNQAAATAGSPAIDVQPAAIDFGNVNVGATVSRQIVIRNTGTANLILNGISVNNAQFRSGITVSQFTLQPGGQLEGSVTFTPSAAGPQQGALMITSNDPNRGTLTVQLRGEGTQSTPTCPTVSGTVTPSSGTVGTSLTIAGQNLTGVTQVRFGGGATATPTVNSQGTQIQVTVPSGAQSGTVNLVKAGCQDTPAGSFQVTQPGNCVTVSISQSLAGAANTTVNVPIMVGDLTGKNVVSYDFTLSYDSTVLRPASSLIDKTGTLSAGDETSVVPNVSGGRVLVTGFRTGSTPFTGAGVLINVRFDVIGAAQVCGNLEFAGFSFNGGVVCSTPSSGRLCVGGSGAIVGTVTYCSDATVAVPGVRVTATGPSTATATTDSAGAYRLNNLTGGPYTVMPSKTDDVLGSDGRPRGINGFDAARVAQHAVNLNPLNGCNLVAGDANGDGQVNGFDAALIAQSAVGINNAQSKVGTWKFTPDKREYSTVSGEQTGQNFTAVLVGDVSGDWRPQSANLVGPEAANLASPSRIGQPALPVWVPSVKAAPGQPMFIPIAVGDLSDLNVTSFDLDIFYDAQALQLRAPAILTRGTLSDGMTVVVNDAVPGRLRISAFGVTVLAGSGDLLRLNFIARKALDNVPLLFWNDFQLNDGTLSVELSAAEGIVKNVSAENYRDTALAGGAYVAAFGRHLAFTTAEAEGNPAEWLAGMSVLLRDAAGLEWCAPMLFVSPFQINYQLPAGAATGVASVTIVRDGVPVGRGMLQINSSQTTREEQR